MFFSFQHINIDINNNNIDNHTLATYVHISWFFISLCWLCHKCIIAVCIPHHGMQCHVKVSHILYSYSYTLWHSYYTSCIAQWHAYIHMITHVHTNVPISGHGKPDKDWHLFFADIKTTHVLKYCNLKSLWRGKDNSFLMFYLAMCIQCQHYMFAYYVREIHDVIVHYYIKYVYALHYYLGFNLDIWSWNWSVSYWVYCKSHVDTIYVTMY